MKENDESIFKSIKHKTMSHTNNGFHFIYVSTGMTSETKQHRLTVTQKPLETLEESCPHLHKILNLEFRINLPTTHSKTEAKYIPFLPKLSISHLSRLICSTLRPFYSADLQHTLTRRL